MCQNPQYICGRTKLIKTNLVVREADYGFTSSSWPAVDEWYLKMCHSLFGPPFSIFPCKSQLLTYLPWKYFSNIYILFFKFKIRVEMMEKGGKGCLHSWFCLQIWSLMQSSHFIQKRWNSIIKPRNILECARLHKGNYLIDQTQGKHHCSKNMLLIIFFSFLHGV